MRGKRTIPGKILAKYITLGKELASVNVMDVQYIAGKSHYDFIKKLTKNYKILREASIPKKEKAEKQLSLFDNIDNI